MTSKSAIVVGADGGIGSAFADILKDEEDFDDVIKLSRSDNSPIKVDIADEESIASAANWLRAKQVEPSLILVATGRLHQAGKGPEKSIKDLDPDWLIETYRINTIGPALIAKHFLPLMPIDELNIFATISARVGSISDNRLGGWYGYRAAKAALNMMIRNLSIEWSRKNKRSIIVALHPGTVDTPLSKPFQANVPNGKLFSPDRAALQLLDVLDALKPADSGKIFAWDGEEISP